ncbi:MAG: DUF234 domain-containing protein [Campylobacterota bacterium]|nr:DUF234 domain-containing protein [Campylobacterota bacterium]
MENMIEYFAVFGGVKMYVDTTLPLKELIEVKILEKYKYLRNDVSELTNNNNKYHQILTALALGDRRTNSAFRKTDIKFDEGIDAVDKLCDTGMLNLEKSLQYYTNLPKNNDISEKLLFTTPFARFWFSFISPIFKGIRDGNYEEFEKEYEKKSSEFSTLIFEQLSHEVLKESFAKSGDKIKEIGRYWDDEVQLDILGKTQSGKIIVGSTKYINSKVKKTELTRVKQICAKLGIETDIFVLFSKKGFTSELKSLKGENLKLFTPRNFNQLIKED